MPSLRLRCPAQRKKCMLTPEEAVPANNVLYEEDIKYGLMKWQVMITYWSLGTFLEIALS